MWSVMKAVVTGITNDLVSKVEVQCDVCKDVYTTQTWSFPRGKDRVKLADDLREAGWLVEGDHQRHVCPRCVVK